MRKEEEPKMKETNGLVERERLLGLFSLQMYDDKGFMCMMERFECDEDEGDKGFPQRRGV